MRRLRGYIFVPNGRSLLRLKMLKEELFPNYIAFQLDPVFGGMSAIYTFLLFALLALGVVTVYSASYQYSSIVLKDSEYFLARQLQALVIGLLGFWLALRLDVNLFLNKRIAWSIYGLAVLASALCAFVFLSNELNLGVGKYIKLVRCSEEGPCRWVRLGPISFQTSEFARFAVVLFLARFCAKRNGEYTRALFYAGLLAVPILLQTHLSGAAIVIFLALALIWGSGLKLFKLAVFAVGFAIVWLVAAKITGYGWDRIERIYKIFSLQLDPTDQLARSMESFATGGLFGVGLGNGVHKFGYLPEIHTDFIFAHLAEEQGIIIALAMLIAFMLLFRWSLELAQRLSSPYQSLLAFGLGVALVLPAFINMLVAVGMFFPTGVPFPLLSYGGSSLVINLFMFGLLLNLSARAFEETLEKPVRWVIAGGGTGGHVVPGIALAQRIVERWPQDYVAFIGVGSPIENRLLSNCGFDTRRIKAAPVVGRKGIRAIVAIVKNLFATFKALELLVKLNPDRVIGVGGYVSVPVVLASWVLRIPIALFEPDAKGGKANRFLARFASIVFVAFESAASRYPQKKTEVIGPLVRQEFFKIEQWRDSRPSGFIVLLLGGSQGAHSLVMALSNALPGLIDLRDKLVIYCQARNEDKELIEGEMKRLGFAGEVSTFFDQVWILYSWADLVISRAGANAVYELCAAKKPAILVPYPYALAHQEKNAEMLASVGAAEVIEDSKLTGELLAQRIRFYVQNVQKLRDMEKAYEKIDLKDGAARMVEIVRSR